MTTVVFDVDDVLFDTPGLKKRLEVIAEERGVEINDLRTPEVLMKIHEADSNFLPSLIYEDVLPFIQSLQELGHKCILISSAQSSGQQEPATSEQVAFQKLKLELTGLTSLVGGEQNVRVTEAGKEEPLGEFASGDSFFVENDIGHLRAAHKLGYKTVHLLRKHKQASGSPEQVTEWAAEAMLHASSLEALHAEFQGKESLAA